MKKKCSFTFIIVFIILILFTNPINAGTLKVTNEHPFLINNQWIDASDLVVGDLIKTIDGKLAKITNIQDIFLKNPTKVYNLEASIFHDFVVGKDQLIVHNSDFPNFDYPPVNLEIDPNVKKQMISIGKKSIDDDRYISRGFIDKDHYFEAIRTGKNTRGGYVNDPRFTYGDIEWRQWKEAHSFLDELSKGNCKEILNEGLILEVASKMPSETVHPSVARIGKGGVTYRTSDVRCGGDIILSEDVFMVYSREAIEGFKANKLLIVEGEYASESSLLLQRLKNLNPDKIDFINANKNNLFIGEVKYSSPYKVRTLMQDLIKKYNTRIKAATTPEEIISVAADFQKDFVSIHPFINGNGRISRLLMDYVLKSKGLPHAHLENTLLDLSLSHEQWRKEVLKGITNAMDNFKCVRN
ncbi:hypothetical protein GOV12_04630 [Candidatus Pacearchaeota archaeon]|nr:hypothetical protein [Candidatus Pacearchaeota archaeon]